MHCFEKQESNPHGVNLGQDVMDQIGLDLCFGLGEFWWGDLWVSMVLRGHWKRGSVEEAQLLEELAHEEANLLKSKYKKQTWKK